MPDLAAVAVHRLQSLTSQHSELLFLTKQTANHARQG